MTARARIGFISVMPSPYQRDFFRALAAVPEIDLSVYYQQAGAGDSPWERARLDAHEQMLPGWGAEFGSLRFQFNIGLPDPASADLWIVNASLLAPSTQWIMRRHLRARQWLFWGERIRPSGGRLRSAIKARASAPLVRASGIVAVGSRAAADYRRRFPGMPIWDIPYHCDLAPFHAISREAERTGPFTFLFCGQMIARKGIDLLLPAFEETAALHSDARLLLVGREGLLPGLMECLRPETRTRIEYAGFRQPADLPALFARADALVLPSRYDGWGVVVNQALAAGLPVVCSDAVAAGDDLIVPGANGSIVPAGDLRALALALWELASDPLRAAAWGRESRRRSFDFTPQECVGKWAAILREVLPSP